MNLRQTVQAGAVTANELIAKLTSTSNQAIKTRENLFAELKGELEQYADIEERHLLPVLRKHPETKDLVPGAAKANNELRLRLAELDRLPKGDESFVDKLTALKQGFQQQVRDERKDILPAILKVLSQEEAEAVAGKIEASATAAEDARRAQVENERQEERRVRARQAAEQRVTEDLQDAAQRMADTGRRVTDEASRAVRTATDQVAETGQHTADAVTDITRSNAATMQQAAQSGMQMAAQLTERSLDQFRRIAGFPAQGETDVAAQQATRNIQAVVECSVVLANGYQNISREWMEQARDRLQKNVDSFSALMAARTPQDAIAAQSDLARRNLENLLQGTRRISELMLAMADEAMSTITSPAAEKAGRARAE